MTWDEVEKTYLDAQLIMKIRFYDIQRKKERKKKRREADKTLIYKPRFGLAFGHRIRVPIKFVVLIV